MNIIEKYKKEIIVICVIIELILVPLIVRNIISLKNKNNNDDNMPIINEIGKQEFGIMYQESYEEQYKVYNGSIMDALNAGYVLNIASSKCNDGSGAPVTPDSVLSINGSMVTIKSNKTIYCTLYFDKGTGEKNNPYKIQYIEDLVDIQVAVNSGKTTYENKYFELWNNLDFNDPKSYRDYTTTAYEDINGNSIDEELKTELTSGTGWKPIGDTETNSFQGIFDGKEHSLSNIYISNNTASASVGLFGVLKNANINNLKITGTMESSVSANMGSIVGRIYGKTTIENIESNTNITGIQGSGSIGGIIGSTSDNNGETTLTHLINRGTIKEGNSTAGIIAWASGLNATIEDCHNYGEISQTGTSSRAGGIVGATAGLQNIRVKINNSSNEGNVTGVCRSGGIIGIVNPQAIEVDITKSYNTGEIIGGDYSGGLIGWSEANSTITESYNTGIVSGNNNIGGLIAELRSGSFATVLNSYNAGNVLSDSGAYATGIGSVYSGNLTIINSYNSGAVSGGASANAGIAIAKSLSSKLIIYNVYNRGIITGTNANGIEYYDSDVIYESNYTYDIPSIGQAFVDTLNSNIDKIDLSSIDSSLSGYTLCRWKLGSSEYPELDC